MLDSQRIEHERLIYGIFDLLGDLGGILEVLTVTITFFLSPFTEHGFFMKAMERLYVAKSRINLFRENKTKEKLEHHFRINFHFYTKLKLFFVNYGNFNI